MSGGSLLDTFEKPLYVDLGLPSGTLWAQGNIVKDANGNYSIGEPNDYGSYFSWGNIDGHNSYSEDNYSFDDTNYNASPGHSVNANIANNDAEHDAAVARLGNGWHIPTKDDYGELFNSNYTTNVWTTQNGINGRLVTSKANGNTLFLPASGERIENALNNRDMSGHYWSSSFYFNNASYALNMFFKNGFLYPTIHNIRKYGFPIRPVK